MINYNNTRFIKVTQPLTASKAKLGKAAKRQTLRL